DRHQFNGADMKLAQMVDDGGVRERPHGSALRFGHIGVQHGEGANRDLVDEATRFKLRAARVERWKVRFKHSFWHDALSIFSKLCETGIISEGTVKPDCVRIDEQL